MRPRQPPAGSTARSGGPRQVSRRRPCVFICVCLVVAGCVFCHFAQDGVRLTGGGGGCLPSLIGLPGSWQTAVLSIVGDGPYGQSKAAADTCHLLHPALSILTRGMRMERGACAGSDHPRQWHVLHPPLPLPLMLISVSTRERREEGCTGSDDQRMLHLVCCLLHPPPPLTLTSVSTKCKRMERTL